MNSLFGNSNQYDPTFGLQLNADSCSRYFVNQTFTNLPGIILAKKCFKNYLKPNHFQIYSMVNAQRYFSLIFNITEKHFV